MDDISWKSNFSLYINFSECSAIDCVKHLALQQGNNSGLFSQVFVVFFNVLYITMFTTGVIANVVFIYNITRRAVRRTIHVYTLNLAVCDLFILLLYVPTQMVYIKDHLKWQMGRGMCKLVNIVLPVTLACTVFTLLAIALDRARDLLYVSRDTLKRVNYYVRRAILTLPVIWLVSITINLPLLILPKLEGVGDEKYCSEGWAESSHGEMFWICMFALLFCLPLVALFVIYLLIVYKVGRSGCVQQRKTIRIGVTLVFVFAVCTGFQHLFFFVTWLNLNENMNANTLASLYVLSNFCVSLQAAINPFIYGWLPCRRRKRSRSTTEIELLQMNNDPR